MSEMSSGPYGDLPHEELILRDYLAAHRTTLANDRTLLAYMRTTLTFLIGGASFIQFFDALVLRVIGWIFVPAAVVTLLMGFFNYRRMKRSLKQIATADRSHAPTPQE
jgi:putative membrane protein